MATSVKANYHKKTVTTRLNLNTDGRSGVFSYAGHFTEYLCGLHISPANEPDRPMTVQLDKEDAREVLRLLCAFLDITSETASEVMPGIIERTYQDIETV